MPLGRATAAADGSLTAPITVPDGLGGWHVVQLLQGGKVKAQVPYFVKRSFVSMPKVVKAGKPFIVELKGVGWTQLDNTVAVTYDNGYIGYACGFNCNGDVRIQLFATGAPGTHLIDLYPLLYTQQPAYPYPQLGMVPLLELRAGRPGPRARVPAAGLPAGDQGRQVATSKAARGRGAARPSRLSVPAAARARRARAGRPRPGSHQLQRPSTAISDGTSTARTSVASMQDGEREAERRAAAGRRRGRRRSPRTRRP